MGYTIRLFDKDDSEALAALTLAAIRQVGPRAYSPSQIAAWAARAPVATWFDEHFAAGAVIIVAADGDGVSAAYALLEAGGHIDMLFCHPDHVGQGLGGMLLAEAEAEARRAGAARLFTEASELARPVFARAGYAELHRRDFTIPFGDQAVAIHNYAMEKRLA